MQIIVPTKTLLVPEHVAREQQEQESETATATAPEPTETEDRAQCPRYGYL